MKKDKESISKLSEFYKVFGDTTRLHILYTLLQKEMCVGDLSKLLNISQSAISHQLKILRLYSLVRYEKKGQCVFYSITDEHVKKILEDGFLHMSEL